MHVGSKRRYNQSAVHIFGKEMVERRSHDGFAHRIAGTFDIRRFPHIEKHSLMSELGNSFEVDRFSRDRSQVDFEISAVINKSAGRADSQSYRAGNRMVDIDEFYFKNA